MPFEVSQVTLPFEVWSRVADPSVPFHVWNRDHWVDYFKAHHDGHAPTSQLELELFVGSGGRSYADWLAGRYPC